LSTYPVSANQVPYSQDEIDRIKGKVPDDLLEFFQTMGRCSFANGFLSTVYPYDIDYHTIFKTWGLKKKGECFVFLRTCFGLLFFYLDGKYYFLDAPTGTYERFAGSADLAINGVISSWAMINEISNYPVYMSHRESLPALKNDEIYMLVPALPLGGSFETSKLEPGKLFEHLSILAELYGNQAEER
jgi:hypothetical protein